MTTTVSTPAPVPTLGVCAPCATDRYARALRDARKMGGVHLPDEPWDLAVTTVRGTAMCLGHAAIDVDSNRLLSWRPEVQFGAFTAPARPLEVPPEA